MGEPIVGWGPLSELTVGTLICPSITNAFPAMQLIASDAHMGFCSQSSRRSDISVRPYVP